MALTSINGYTYFALINGTLYLDSTLTALLSITNIPAHTNTKAKSVPILVSANTKSRLRNKAGMPTTNPVSIVEKDGVLNFGCILENILGNNPSLLMLIHILGCPI